MTISDLEFLLSPTGQHYLQEFDRLLREPKNELPWLKKIRRTLSQEEAGAILTTIQLRQKAQTKFPQASGMYFLPSALEQATSWELAQHRAELLDRYAPPGPVIELGCGIGADTLALADLRPVIAYELDPVRIRLAQANVQSLTTRFPVEFCQADYLQADLPPAAAIYIDPARRQNGKRLQQLESMEPPLSAVLRLLSNSPNLIVKLAPSVPRQPWLEESSEASELYTGLISELKASRMEFVGIHNECREAVLWLGEPALKACGPGHHISASLLDTQGQWHTLEASQETPPLGEMAAGQYLLEPEPVFIRAGALKELATLHPCWSIDPSLAWLVSDSPLPPELSYLGSCFRLEELGHFALKTIQQRVRELQIARLEIKKRNFAMEPSEVRKKLKLCPQGREAVLILTRINQVPTYLLGSRC